MTQTQRFDQEAATWDENPRRVRLAKAVAQTIAQQIPLSGAMDVLDFGCGTGLLTLKLQPLVGTITGSDTSSGMLEVLGGKVKDQQLDSVACLLLEGDGSLALKGAYDLIVSNMTLHHVEALGTLFRQFYEHLRAGGYIALADLDKEDGTFHGDAADVFHLGFLRSELKNLLASAGFADLEDTTAFEIRRNGRDYPVFLVTGRKNG
jgi:tRNA (cmo5U34)-methyltransferase